MKKGNIMFKGSHFLDFSKPFITSTQNIFETMCHSKAETQKPFIKKSQSTEGDITSIMGLSGHVEKDGIKKMFKGMLILSWPESTYVKVASAMMMEEHKKISPDIIDVGAEIANMITGNSKRYLNEIGYQVEMSIPSTILGKNITVNYPPNVIIISIPTSTIHGIFIMERCYLEE
jgi:chemotaxis protein CheX